MIALFSGFATAAAGLHRVGRGSQNLLSGGLYRDPDSPARPLMRGGVLAGGHRRELDHALVREHTRFSWFSDVGPQHPWQTVIQPDRSRAESYSWAAAPRYGDATAIAAATSRPRGPRNQQPECAVLSANLAARAQTSRSSVLPRSRRQTGPPAVTVALAVVLEALWRPALSPAD